MFPCINSYSILYILFAWSIGICYGFVLLSSAAGDFSDVNVFKEGDSLRYNLQSTVLLNERNLNAKNVGFFIDGEVSVDVVWGSGDQKLLKIMIDSPKLHIRSRKAPSPDGFIPHSSKLDNIENKPFLLVWNKGRIEKILTSKDEPVSIRNVKKGVASLFQLLDGEITETDASGTCTVTYTSLSPTIFRKMKTNCISEDFKSIKNPNKMLGVEIESKRMIQYELEQDTFQIKSVISRDSHTVFLTAREEMGNHIEADQVLTFVTNKKADVIKGNDVEDAIDNISEHLDVNFNQESLITGLEPIQAEDVVTFVKKVESLRNQLKIENIGSLKQAKAFVELVNVARSAGKEDILKTLGSKKNKAILSQLYDILGYVGTMDSYTAVMKNLHFDKEDQIDLSERYLWALSFSSQVNSDILKDLLKKFTQLGSIPDKVKETLILTIGTMAHKLSQSSRSELKFKLIRDVEEAIINNLDYSKNEDKIKYFRALKNLKSQASLPVLLSYIKNGTQKEGVLAWKAIKAFGPNTWDREVLIAAEKTFFQLDRRHDSSSRTIAADILLESVPSDELLKNFLNFLISNDPYYEVKQYVYQKMKMLAEFDQILKNKIDAIIKSNKMLNNYSGINPRGLSLALTRRFVSHSTFNGSLVSVQEMKSGIAKRGTIDVVLEKGDLADEIFSLGIFSGGLHSLISSDSETGEDVEEENATAGIELTVLGTQIRPFVFFNGQGELMGHVWSGTASERTPAFQVLALLHDHSEYIRLGSGFITKIDFKGATSFDLSGKIEISLWNRNAESLVGKSAGIIVVGSSTVDSSFVRTKIDFSASMETQLDLQTDIDFSSNIHLCMRLTQPDTLFRHNIYKVERIPGSKHKMRISKYQKYVIPGTTYAINKKNNEMCNAIFS